jgi:hypothetical protein
MKNKTITLVLLAITWLSCEKENNNRPSEVENNEPVNFLRFDGGSIYKRVADQVAIGPRNPGSDGHRQVQNLIIDSLKNWSVQTIVQDFEATAYDGRVLNGKNIIASLFPEKKKRILIATHYDTRPYADQASENQEQPILGANDGGSGTAVLLEFAKQFSTTLDTPNVGIDLFFIDLEDSGRPSFSTEDYNDRYGGYCLGSRYWSKNVVPENYRGYYGILLDMVGAKGATFTQEGHSLQFAPKVVKKVWQAAQKAGYSSYFPYTKTEPITDDHIFINQAGTPTIDIIHYDQVNSDPFFRHWHKHSDDLSTIDSVTLEAVANTVSYTIYAEK